MTSNRLPDGFLDEIKARIRPSDLIGRQVKLRRSGKEWVGLSPFNVEKTPSFYVNDQKGIFKDFSSGLGGDIIKFVQETERLDFMEAVERLAHDAGLELPRLGPEAKAEYDKLDRLKAACAAATRFFVEQLHAAGARGARTYLLERRGLGPQAWARWQLGYAPDDWQALRTHLHAQGFSDAELIAAGLARQSEKGGAPYDVFRGRIIFPITDRRGDVIAFGGRALDPDAKAKYLNSPDTDLFHKSTVLYNYARARGSISYGDRGGLIVCEGYMDVIALGEAGFANAVAPLGTALTHAQLDLLWKAGPDPVVCLDGDGAGRRAAERVLDVALPKLLPDRSAYFCFLPEGMDPDDLLGQPDGVARMRGVLDDAVAFIEMLWRRERDLEPLDTPERQAGLETRLKALAGRIEHPGVRAAYDRDLRARMREHLWQQRLARRPTTKRAGAGARPAIRADGADLRRTGLALIARAIANPWLIDDHGETLAHARFPDRDIDAIRDAVFDVVNNGGEVDRLAITTHLQDAGKKRAAQLLEEQTDIPHLDPDTPGARDWLIALEDLAVDTRPTTDANLDELDKMDWTDFVREINRRTAERQARFMRRGEATRDVTRD